MSNLSLLFKEWRDTLKLESSGYGNLLLYLSAIVYFEPIPPGNTTPYPVQAINEYVDFISPVCYDYYWGVETSVTAENALLNDHPGKKSTDEIISSWIKARVSAEKLVMGLPLFGKKYVN